jgi:hypothetical protein
MSIVLLGSTSGSCTLQEQAVAGTTTLTLPTFNGTVGLLVSGTAVASTSGTSIDFTGIPAGVRRITVMFSGVSTNSTSAVQIQLGDAGGIETTGYAASGAYIQQVTPFAGVINVTSGFALNTSSQAANSLQGSYQLTLLGSNTWVGNGLITPQSSTPAIIIGAGSKALSDTLDRIRITTVNGTDTFDAGTINILYE